MSSYVRQLRIEVDKAVRECGKQVVSRGYRAVNEIRNAELEVLSGSRSGRLYKKPHFKTRYRASAPGEAPARRTGSLRLQWNGSVTSETKSGNEIRVLAVLTSQNEYSGLLDEGTAKIAPRPFKQRIIDKAAPKIHEIYSQPYT